jgi:hypothetical protein
VATATMYDMESSGSIKNSGYLRHSWTNCSVKKIELLYPIVHISDMNLPSIVKYTLNAVILSKEVELPQQQDHPRGSGDGCSRGAFRVHAIRFCPFGG